MNITKYRESILIPQNPNSIGVSPTRTMFDFWKIFLKFRGGNRKRQKRKTKNLSKSGPKTKEIDFYEIAKENNGGTGYQL